MTIRLRLSDSGDAHFGSSDPRSARVPSAEPTTAEIEAEYGNALSVEEYSKRILTDKAKSDPAYRRQLDAQLAAGHYHDAVRDHMTAATNESSGDRVAQIIALQPGTAPEIAQAAIRAGSFFNTEAQIAALRAAQASGSANAMAIYESRVALSMLEGR